jgi:NAD(P)-dependent dehydrogenase (short-subunit alcohol dehydrogenase family)
MSEPDIPVLERFSLAGKVALVTGASSGLGAGFAVALAQAGADVVLAARRRDGLEAARREVEKLGRSALAVPADVTDPGACRAVVQARDLNQQWSGRRGIRVNAVAPGYFRSEMTDQIPRDKLDEFIAGTSTLGRMGEQHELDTVVVFLASPASSYIAGVTLAVDGGMSGH